MFPVRFVTCVPGLYRSFFLTTFRASKRPRGRLSLTIPLNRHTSPAHCSSHAVRLAAVEQALAGKPATKETIANASATASVDELNSDIHASDEYRRAMLKVFARRALEAALARV